jgi:Tfp pilus assembly protein PilO
MSLPVDREFITQAIIALGACLGGWMFFVQPKAEEVRALDADITKLRARSTGPSHEAVEQIAKQAPKLRDRCIEIEARGAMAKDTSLLYGQVMSLAKEHDVQVRNLRPGEQKPGRTKSVIATRIDMTAEGEYEQIAEFLGALDGIRAYLRTTSVQIAPTKRVGGSYAVVQLGFEALQFRLPKVVTDMKRLGDEHP